MNLEFRVEIQKSLTNSLSKYSLVILEQTPEFTKHIRKLNNSFQYSKLRMKSESRPDYCSDIFFIRGSDSISNLNVILMNELDLYEILNCIYYIYLSNLSYIIKIIHDKNNIYIDIYKSEHIRNNNLYYNKLKDELSKYISLLGSVCILCSQVKSINKDWICDDCMKLNKQCHRCKSYVNEYNIHELKDLNTNETIEEIYCKFCYKTYTCKCGNKEVRWYTNIFIEISDDGTNNTKNICRSCSNATKRCYNCNNHYDNKKCPCLIPLDFKKMINSWNSDVTEILPKDQFSIELFGIEIEVGTHVKNRENYKKIKDHTYQLVSSDAILKYDSSIDYLDGSNKTNPNEYRGFEIVTRPMSYKNSIRFLNNLGKNKHNLLRSWEVGTTGVHIHVNKYSMSRMEIGKIIKFINDLRNRKFIIMIAKREDKKYAKFLNRRILDYNDKSKDAHYYSINTNKPYTIEFRIFRGTLNTQTLLSYLQFVKSLIEFVKVTEVINLRYENYVEWLQNTNRSRFRELKARIKSENFDKILDKGEI